MDELYMNDGGFLSQDDKTVKKVAEYFKRANNGLTVKQLNTAIAAGFAARQAAKEASKKRVKEIALRPFVAVKNAVKNTFGQ